jgi:hypothetical protein
LCGASSSTSQPLSRIRSPLADSRPSIRLAWK